MITNNTRVALKDVVAKQLPEFVRENYPTFVAFVEAYYEFMGKNNIDIRKVRDVDLTLDEFIQYFKKELAHNFPANVQNPRFVMKHVRDEYLAKGSEASYRLLFRLLYGKEIYMEYPGKSMLRVSDGRWKQDVSVFVRVDAGNPNDVVGKAVDVQTSRRVYRTEVNPLTLKLTKVTVNIESAVLIDEANNIWEIFLDRNFYGSISPGDVIKFGSSFQSLVLPTTAKLKIQNVGEGFKPGMIFQVASGNGTPIWFKVTSVDDNGGLVNIDVIKFGLSYDTDFSITILPSSAVRSSKKIERQISTITYSKINDTIGAINLLTGGANYLVAPDVIIGGNGSGATAHAVVEGGVVTEIILDTQGEGYTTYFVNIVAQDGDTGSGATAEVITGDKYTYNTLDKSSGFNELGYINYGDYWDVTEHGRNATATSTVRDNVITSLEVTNQGSGYTTATVNVTDASGSGIVATPVIVAGKITRIDITTYGYGYVSPTVNIVGDGSGAEATAVIKDGCVTAVTLVAGGVGYDLSSPVVDINFPLDINGAVIPNATQATAKAIVNGAGTITGFSVTNPGSGYPLPPTVAAPKVTIRGSYGYADGAYVGTIARQFYIDAKDTIAGNPALINVTLDALAKYPGYYKSNDGFLDDAMYVQDSYYYQAFSYVVRIDEQLTTYASAVRSMLHPSGMALFGEYSINNKFDLSVALEVMIKSLGITVYDAFTVTDDNTKIFFYKGVTDAVVLPEGGSSVIDYISSIVFSKALDDSITQSDSWTHLTTKGLTETITESESWIHTTTKGLTETITEAETWSIVFSQSLAAESAVPTDTFVQEVDKYLTDTSVGDFTQSGYLVLNPYEEGGYFLELYANAYASTFN